MTFGAPQYLWVLCALPALAGFVWWMAARRRASVSRMGDSELVERLSASVNPGARLRRAVLWFVGAGTRDSSVGASAMGERRGDRWSIVAYK